MRNLILNGESYRAICASADELRKLQKNAHYAATVTVKDGYIVALVVKEKTTGLLYRFTGRGKGLLKI